MWAIDANIFQCLVAPSAGRSSRFERVGRRWSMSPHGACQGRAHIYVSPNIDGGNQRIEAARSKSEEPRLHTARRLQNVSKYKT